MPIPSYTKQTAGNENLEHHLITDHRFKGSEHQFMEKWTSLNHILLLS